MGEPLRLVLVEDSEVDAELLLTELRRGGFAPQAHRVVDEAGLRAALSADEWDMAILDYRLPSFSAPAAIEVIREMAADVPIVVVSGAIGDEQAVETLKAGAGDYVLKDNLARLAPAVRRGLGEAGMRRDRQAAVAALSESEERYRLLFERLRKTFDETVECLASLTELRDPYTAGHQRRVAELAEAIGEQMEFDQATLDGLRVAAAVHDIGKMHVPAEILAKPGALSDVEMAIVRSHPEAGHSILKPVSFPWPVADIVAQHHERLDGSGYPRGLRADDIRREAAVLGVADVVEAMSSHRPYRAARGIEQALDHLATESGRRFEPAVAKACAQVWQDGSFAFSVPPEETVSALPRAGSPGR